MLPAKRLDMLSQSLNSEGYGGDIQFAMGVQNDGTLNGISILSISETAGLGMKATTDSLQRSSLKTKRRKIYIHKNRFHI